MELTRRRAILLIIAVLLAAAALAGLYAAFRTWFPEEEVRSWAEEWLEPLGPWGPIAYIAIFAASMLFAPIPTAPAPVIASAVFGGAFGYLYTMIAVALGSAICFWAARLLGRPALRRLVSQEALSKIDQLGQRLGIRLLIVLRLFPIAGVDYVSYAAGLTRMPFGSYLVISVLASAPILGLAALLGESLYENNWIMGAAALAALAVVFILPLAWVAWKRGREERREREAAQLVIQPEPPLDDR